MPALLSPPAVRTLPNADLPVIISKAILQPPRSPVPELNQFDLPQKVLFLDIHTLRLSDEVIRKATTLKHRNRIANLRYSVKLLSWSEEACKIRLEGKYEREGIPPIDLNLSKQVTVLVAVNDNSRLFFAFTFLGCTAFLSQFSAPGNLDGIRPPEAVSNPTPPFPEDMIRGKEQGLFTVMTVITEEGKVDPSRWIVQECVHPLFARSSTKTILEQWEFRPGFKDDKTVEVVATIEVKFTLY